MAFETMAIGNQDWPHAPVHKLGEHGAYMVTAGTYGKISHLNSPERLENFTALLFGMTHQFGWELQAWAVMSNHYHFVAVAPERPETLGEMIARLHHESALTLNAIDSMPNRRVWFQYWDTHLSYQKSYMARLKYVHTNPVHHGVVKDAEQYRWCSMWWFSQHTGSGFQRAVQSFEIASVKVVDDF